jgi:hypothetical protein
MMIAVLERSKRLREILDVIVLLVFAARHPDLNDVATLLHAEQAADVMLPLLAVETTSKVNFRACGF